MAATILLVDANSSNGSGWKAFLENQGYTVVEAQNGRRAIEECPLVQPDLVLLNASLPDMQGFQVCQALKADPQNRLTPVILMAETQRKSEVSPRFEAGPDDFWSKPSSRWEVLNRVQSILQLKSYIDQQAEGVLFILARSIESKNPLMTGHSERIAEYTVQFGEILGLMDDELENLRIASLLHDIGKVAVPDSILLKPGRLTPEEMKVMRQHPVVGEEICSPLKSFRQVLPAIRHHHERMDGSGYPDGLEGDAIPRAARILQLTDIYDALTTERPYRKALSLADAVQIMNTEAKEGLLDRVLLEEFLQFVSNPTPRGSGRHSMLHSYMTH